MSPRKPKARSEPVPLRFPPSGELADRWLAAVQFAIALPGTEESRSYGTPALKVRGKLIARLRSEAEGGLALRCEISDREVLLRADPEAFYVTDHYLDYPMILVDLARVERSALEDLIERAWRSCAPKRLVDQFDGEPLS